MSGATDVLTCISVTIVLRRTTHARIAGFSGPSSSYHGAGMSSCGNIARFWNHLNPKAPHEQHSHNPKALLLQSMAIIGCCCCATELGHHPKSATATEHGHDHGCWRSVPFLLEILCDDLLERLSELDLPSDLRRHGRSVLLQSKPTSP